MPRETVSDTFGAWALLAAAPVEAGWDESPAVPLAVLPCLSFPGRFARIPFPEPV